MDHEETLLPTLIKRSARLIDRQIDLTLKEHGIARSQYRVLHYVARQGELTQKELAGLLQVEAATLTRIIDALVKKGWLTRVRDNEDQRVRRIRLTPEGERQFGDIPQPARALNRTITRQLDDAEAAALQSSLVKIIEQLS